MKNQEELREAILTAERSAVERWYGGDPSAFLELCAADVTYFDTWTPERVHGREALREYIAEVYGEEMKGLEDAPARCEMVDPRVHVHGDAAVVTYNLDFHPSGDKPAGRWSTTEFYRLLDEQWRIVHSHWSLVKED